METFDLLKLVIGGGEVAVLALVLYKLVGAQGQQDAGYLAVITSLVGNIEANTKVMQGLTTAASETKTLVEGGRREHASIVGALSDERHGLAALEAKIDGLPTRTAGAVRAELKEDLEKIRAEAARVALGIDSLVNKLDALPVAVESTETESKQKPEPGAESSEAPNPQTEQGAETPVKESESNG